MAVQSPSTRVHFEMASYAEAELLYQLTQYIIPYADSLGMNEQVKEIKTSNLAVVLLSNVSFCVRS